MGESSVLLVDDSMILLMEEPDGSSAYIAVYSLSKKDKRLHLLLPFATLPEAYVVPHNVFGENNSTSYYSCDPSSDKISHIRFVVGPNYFDVVISAHQVIKLVPAPTKSYKTLRWHEWVPMCTRWFQYFSTPGRARACGSWIFFPDDIPSFIHANGLSSSPESYIITPESYSVISTLALSDVTTLISFRSKNRRTRCTT